MTTIKKAKPDRLSLSLVTSKPRSSASRHSAFRSSPIRSTISRQSTSRPSPAFTIVELLIVIVIIAILASITIVAYNGIQNRAKVSVLMSDLNNGSKQLKIDQVNNGSYPSTLAAANAGQGLRASSGTTYRYSVNNSANPQTFCLSATDGTTFYMITESGAPTEGSCVNVALGASSPDSRLTDGNTASSSYYEIAANGGLPVSVTVDLGSSQDISMIKVWHYYADGRTYNNTKTEVSVDNTNWTSVYDSATAGTYRETSSGKSISFSLRKVRYIRDWVMGSSSNPGNHWVEIQAF